jgi:hypothetical protein
VDRRWTAVQGVQSRSDSDEDGWPLVHGGTAIRVPSLSVGFRQRVAASTATDPDAEAKVVRPYIADEPRFRARFRREVEAARQVGGFWTTP